LTATSGVDPNPELVARNKANLDITWLRETADDDGELLPPEVIAQEIVEDLQAALGEFAAVADALQAAKADTTPDMVDD
jgi:type I restriction enzyme M protein